MILLFLAFGLTAIFCFDCGMIIFKLAWEVCGTLDRSIKVFRREKLIFEITDKKLLTVSIILFIATILLSWVTILIFMGAISQ